jgi:GalNAc-alpha-(1->4)-GalNAc-alpha-(1->3)-diNAcBac-PP-undecaprenol alpha-1,4-N-acetyl-D-galactosaminyltransferase
VRRITLVIPSLTSGGAERVMATMANHWVTTGRQVTLLTLDDGNEPPFFPLHPAVQHHSLGVYGESRGALRAVRNNVERIFTLRRAIARSKPDVVLSFLDTTNVLTLLATRGLGLPVIVEEHTDPAQKTIGRWESLRRLLYPRASRVVVLSETAREYFGPGIRSRSVVMPNPISVAPPGDRPAAPRARRTLIALGRLGPEKGFDLLIDSFAEIAERHAEWDLVIRGEGPRRRDLEQQRDRLGLANRVSLLGRTSTPYEELRQADLFVMSSRREGFPMALGEAMACGLPAVSTDCPSGPRQIIRPGIDGLLVPPDDVHSLAGALSQVMGDDALRTRLASREPEVLERFGIEQIMARWETLFDQVSKERKTPNSRRIRTFGPARMGSTNRPKDYDAG